MEPSTLTETVGLLEVVPVTGVTESQPPALEATAVYVSGWPVLPTVTVCAGGADPPLDCVNESAVGLNVRLPVVTCSVTGRTVVGSATPPEPVAEIVTLPV